MISIFKDLAHTYNKCVIVVSHSHELAAQSDVVYRFGSGGLKLDNKDVQ
jgi:putative ABC transport system ATP-binding protein